MTALKYRLGVSFPELTDDEVPSLRCVHCKDKIMDDQGYHFAGGCPCGGHRQKTHNAVVDTIVNVLSKAGRKVRKGEKIYFKKGELAKPKNKEGIIPDIEVYHKGKKDLLDVTIVNRSLPFVNTNNKKLEDSATAEEREKAKIHKYEQHGVVSNANGQVIPVALENFGKIGKMGLDYLMKAADEYGKGYRAMTMKRYWLRLISVALHNHIGQAVQIQLQEFNQGRPKTLEDEIEDEREFEMLREMEIGVKHAPTQRGLKSGLNE